MKINIYDERGKEIIKVCESDTYDLSFGTIQRILKIINIDDWENTSAITKSLFEGSEELERILLSIFEDLERQDVERIKIKELAPLLIEIVQNVLEELKEIPEVKKLIRKIERH